MLKYNLSSYLKELFKKRKLNLIGLLLYFLFVTASMVYWFCLPNLRNAFVSLILLAVTFVIPIVEWLFNIRTPGLFLLLFLFIPAGSLLGSCFEFYSNYSWFDDLLHTLSGFIFACFGFSIFQLFIGKIRDKKNFLGCLIGGLLFSLAAGLLWELFEYGGLKLLNVDMQEDCIIHDITSFFLAGSHNNSVDINGITETVIHYENGQMFVVQGYLDLGLQDTLFDMFVCFLGSLAYIIVFVVAYRINKKSINLISPHLNEEI